MGKAVKMKSHQQEEMKEKFKENQFNLLASDMIMLNRSLADVRHKELSLMLCFAYQWNIFRFSSCRTKTFPTKLPTTSIVIVFHNEAWSTLLRTIWSVINRSPRPLLKEIILVDDASERDYLGEQLEDYVKTLPVSTYGEKTYRVWIAIFLLTKFSSAVLRTGKRSGLIRARLLGAKHVKGQIITFLDAHCEVNHTINNSKCLDL